ncbi:MAG: fumarate hydratase [Coriobacteriales bacterium]|nr:fumarate hydratase [Actinomycetes bacterium]
MIPAARIADEVERTVPLIATSLRDDVLEALQAAYADEPSERGREVIRQLLDNAAAACERRVPLCQDTGTVWVWVELGQFECIEGDLQGAVDDAVARAYEHAGLRMSVVADALFDRRNTTTNTPAFVDVTSRPGKGATVHMMLKGGGSDNASALFMLEPSLGEQGVFDAVVSHVCAKATTACPPLLVGVGVGGTFDTVPKLSKKALLRPIGTRAANQRVTAFEQRVLHAVNRSGIGPAGLGGRTTALAVHVLTAPCHIAALPVAVNVGCIAMRSAMIEVEPS